jgi:cellobiose phosphorylase
MNGDWNDTLDHIGPKGKGETVWGAFFLGYVIRKTYELLEFKQDHSTLERWKAKYEQLRKVIDESCWDGKWYLRAFRDDGSEVGSSKHKQGKIFVNAQSWSVISGLAPFEKAKAAMKSGKKYLTTPYGMQIVYPSYTEVEDNTGLISRCVPGKKENGAVFNHASAWFVLASILNGDVDFAYETYSKMLPANSSKNIDKYEVEPYVFAEYITSPDHETENQASHSWLTGTAVWMLRIGIDYICGFKTSLNGITIEPHIPSKWKSFSAERNLRGKTIKLKVENPKGKNSGIKLVEVNGNNAKSNFINPDDFSEKEIKVKIILG